MVLNVDSTFVIFLAVRLEEEAEKERVGKLMLHIATNLDFMEDKKARC